MLYVVLYVVCWNCGKADDVGAWARRAKRTNSTTRPSSIVHGKNEIVKSSVSLFVPITNHQSENQQITNHQSTINRKRAETLKRETGNGRKWRSTVSSRFLVRGHSIAPSEDSTDTWGVEPVGVGRRRGRWQLQQKSSRRPRVSWLPHQPRMLCKRWPPTQ